jgi:hypothetical protein
MRGKLLARIDPAARQPILQKDVRDEFSGEGER